jgi:amino acid transporter
MGKKRMNWGMIGFFVEMCALTIWVGGLLMIIAVVIPAVFNSFGMEPAGRFLRRVFDGYGYLNLGILLLLSLVAFLRFRTYGQDPSHLFTVTSGEWWLLGGMFVVTVGILGVLGPQAIALQEQAFEAISKEEKELAYEQFFRLHMIVRALHLVNVGLAFSLFILKLRKAVVRPLVDSR